MYYHITRKELLYIKKNIGHKLVTQNINILTFNSQGRIRIKSVFKEMPKNALKEKSRNGLILIDISQKKRAFSILFGKSCSLQENSHQPYCHYLHGTLFVTFFPASFLMTLNVILSPLSQYKNSLLLRWERKDLTLGDKVIN